MKKERAIFAAGCFWGVEYVFSQFPGVSNIECVYTGGKVKNPTYEQVCSGTTGHAESISFDYDTDKISYEKLLEIFFKCHDPTTMNRQGPDIGDQYRSAIFYLDDKQKKAAESAKKDYEKVLGKKIVTQILPAKEIYVAEEYHQNYYKKTGKAPYCHIVPKVK